MTHVLNCASILPENIDNLTCADNVDTHYHTCTTPDQCVIELEQPTPLSSDLKHKVPSFYTSRDIHTSLSYKYSLRPGTRRDYQKIAHHNTSIHLTHTSL